MTETIRLLLVGLYSSRYAAMGEMHSLSALGGAVAGGLQDRLEALAILDMVPFAEESLERAARMAAEMRANVIGISVPYGTYSTLEAQYHRLANAKADGALVVFGGALPTYLADDILTQIDPAAVIVAGEGDEAFPSLLAHWSEGGDWRSVPNVVSRQGDVVTASPRRLCDVTRVPPPYREHLGDLIARGGQIFVESSRGCSWAACTFCLRGLTDVKGRGTEYRRFPAERLVSDVEALRSLGVDAVTFADEDFLGGLDATAGEYLSELEALTGGRLGVNFMASMTVHSVYDERDSSAKRCAREERLARLHALGLRKVFLGIESGSTAQLKRFAKGHTRDEALGAVQLIRRLGISVEVGCIMFDPLSRLEELHESVSFLLANGLVADVSAVASRLRLQRDSTFIRILEQREVALGRQLYCRDLDRDTLSYEYEFEDPAVGRLGHVVDYYSARLGGFYYPLKNLSRYAVVDDHVDRVAGIQELVVAVRMALAEVLRVSTSPDVPRERAAETAGALLAERSTALAYDCTELVAAMPKARSSTAVIEQAAEAASALLQDIRSGRAAAATFAEPVAASLGLELPTTMARIVAP